MATKTFMRVTCPSCKTERTEEKPAISTAAHSESIYNSVPLNGHQRVIRTLVVHCGSFNNEMKCSLQTVSLDDDPTYTALSYSWGNPQDTCDITLNNQKITIRNTLAVALRYMRRDDKDIVVWADAICINQNDTKEKSCQVAMMGDIYSKAAEVWIWLGEASEDSDKAMDLLNSLPTIDFDDPGYSPDQDSWSALKQLVQRKWWSRLWIVQEALLARRAVVHCGRKAVDLEAFVSLREVETRMRRIPEERLRPMQSGLTSPFGVILLEYRRLKAEMRLNGGVRLFQMFSNTGRAECELPIDKIYGLLSMSLPSERQILKVDYDYCVRCILLHCFAMFFIHRTKWHPLTLLQTGQAKKREGLPSWLPDYTQDDFENHLMFPPSETSLPFRAGADNSAWATLGVEPVPETEDTSNSLRMRLEFQGSDILLVIPGLIVDTITAASECPFVEFYTGPDHKQDREKKLERRRTTIEACRNWRQTMRERLPGGSDVYQNACGLEEAFWRTIIADRDYNWQGPVDKQDFESRFNAWLDHGEQSHDEEHTRPFSDPAVTRCMYRSFLITTKGYLGLGRSSTRPGDIVTVLKGGNVPFVLRPCNDGFYTLIGESYVHGIMDGDFVRNSAEKDVRNFWIR